MKKRLCALLTLLLLILCGHALADSGLSAQGLITVRSIETENLRRTVDACVVSASDLGCDEYYAFSFRVTNSGSADRQLRAYARIDGGEKLGWGDVTLAAGNSVTYHIYHSNMGKLSPGTYKVDFYVNDELLTSQYFSILKDWSGLMRFPTDAQVKDYKTGERSPYITCEPDFGISGYTQYAVDFKADYTPNGTYLSVGNWTVDLSDVKRQYRNAYQPSISGYCGFQVLENGTRVAIMSLWDVYYTDSNGNQRTLVPTLTYNAPKYAGGRHDEEGGGINCLVYYDWKAGNPYRALIQMGTSATTGNTVMEFWVLDLVTMQWTRLIEYDLGFTTSRMTWTTTFLENYITRYAGAIRTMELSNFRAYSLTGKWVSAKSATFGLNGYTDSTGQVICTGSYNWGSDGRSFWTITTGLPNRATVPTKTRFTVNACETGSPIP